MHLYEQEYGYTYLRLFVYFILITEILVLIPTTLEIYGVKINVFEISIKIIISMYIILNFINIDYIIAKNNIEKFLSNPGNGRLDVYYITSKLGIDAIEEKIRLLNQDIQDLPYEKINYMNNIKTLVRANLSGYKIEYENYKFKWQEWNLSRARAYKILTEGDFEFEK